MNPRLRLFAIVFAGLFWLAVAKVCFGADVNAAMTAARLTGMPRYLAFERNGKRDGAAVFPLGGVWWFYHPEIGGSVPTGFVSSRKPPMLPARYLSGRMSNVHWERVTNRQNIPLLNGCLPRAIYRARQAHKSVCIRNHHAFVTR